jgi:hypothetical protein
VYIYRLEGSGLNDPQVTTARRLASRVSAS